MTASVLVNCDDLGMHPTINEAIVEILSEGIVKSASLMAVGNFFDDAARRLERAGIGEIGVHLALGSEYAALPTRPLSAPGTTPTLVQPDGSFFPDIRHLRHSYALDEVRRELLLQVDRVRAAGLRVTHLDGHMFFYLPEESDGAVYALVQELADALGVPCRGGESWRGSTPRRTCFLWGETSDPGERLRRYAEWFASDACDGSEIIIHPAKDAEALRPITASADWRHADYVAFRREALEPLLGDRVEIVSWPEAVKRSPPT